MEDDADVLSLIVAKKEPADDSPAEEPEEEPVKGGFCVDFDENLISYVYYIFLIIVLMFVLSQACMPETEAATALSKLNPFNYI